MDEKHCNATARKVALLGVAVAIAVGLLMGLGLQRTSRPDALPPGLRLSSDTLDLGLLSPDAVASGAFTMSNRGTRTYRIDKVIPECGCTVAHVAQSLVSPGSASQITVSIRGSQWGDGFRTKELIIRVAEDDGTAYDIILKVSASVVAMAELAVIPSRLEIRAAEPGQLVTVPLYVRGDKAVVENLPSDIRLSGSLSLHLRIKPPKRQGWLASRKISVSVVAPDRPAQRSADGAVQVELAGDFHQRMEIPIRLNLDYGDGRSGARRAATDASR